MSNFPVIDLVFLILIVITMIHGYVRGFVQELFSWAALILAIGAAVFLYPQGGAFIRGKIMENVRYVPEILAFIAIFLIIMILVRMIEHILKDVITGAKLGGVNKLLGAVFGLLEGFAFTMLILFILAVQPFFDASGIIGESIFAQILLPVVRLPLNRSPDVVNTALLYLPDLRFLI